MNYGLRLDADARLYATTRRLLAGGALVVPRRVDNRSLLLRTSDQGSTSECAAYAMAGVIEFERWRDLGVYEQVDPHPIYQLAKEIDADNQPGTSLNSVLQAAEDLGLIRVIKDLVVVDDANAMMRAVHRHGVLLAGFEIDDGWMDVRPDGWITQSFGQTGGHAEVICGFDQDEDWVGCQGSWGDESYGWRGFVRMHFDLFRKQYRYGLTWDYAT